MKIIFCYADKRADEYSLLNNVCRGMIFYVKENIYKMFKGIGNKSGSPLQVYSTEEYVICYVPLIIKNELFIFTSIDYLTDDIVEATKKAVKYLSNNYMYLKWFEKYKKFAYLKKDNSLIADFGDESKENKEKIKSVLVNSSKFEENWDKNLIFTSPSKHYMLGNFQFTKEKKKADSKDYEVLLNYFTKINSKNKFVLFGTLITDEKTKHLGQINEHILETAENTFILQLYRTSKAGDKKIQEYNEANMNLWGNIEEKED